MYIEKYSKIYIIYIINYIYYIYFEVKTITWVCVFTNVIMIVSMKVEKITVIKGASEIWSDRYLT